MTDWPALMLSLRLSATTTVVLLVAAQPLAAWLAFSSSAATRVLRTLIALPLVLPPTVLGYYMLHAASPASVAGSAWQAIMGRPLAFSFEGLVLATVLTNLPVMVLPAAAACSGVDKRLIDVARTLGRPWVVIYARVVLPLAWPGVLAGAAMTFAHCLGEFGVVLMIGGSIPGETRTASIAVYESVQVMDHAAAGRMSAILLAVAFAALLASTWPRSRWRMPA